MRAIAACTRANGWHTGYSCTDGLVIDGEEIARGDYSGPLGARTVLRSPRVESAVLETARGGILRRGLAIATSRAAVVTNLSADHFGEYGVDDLPALADVKLTVAGTIGHDGLLVLNADDPLLVAKSATLETRFGRCPPLGWFAADYDANVLRAHRGRGGATCGIRSGQMLLAWQGHEHSLGAVAAMPLTAGGRAAYNVANLAAAALAAVALGVSPTSVAATFADFGAAPHDNPGRLMRYEVAGVHVLIDYAHNPGRDTRRARHGAAVGRYLPAWPRWSGMPAIAWTPTTMASPLRLQAALPTMSSSRRTRPSCAAVRPGKCRRCSGPRCCVTASTNGVSRAGAASWKRRNWRWPGPGRATSSSSRCTVAPRVTR